MLQEPSEAGASEHREGFITASPLDYHLFRQEITSKYPAYSPPQPLVPIEPENNSILPPLPNHISRRTSQESLRSRTGPDVTLNPGSIFNQPVHIATPAPSPPPSPAGPGGKGGKKQNYQTNQNFPFLYPPLDDTSNTVGGKGTAELQDKLVGKRWEGSDVPTSIQEAGELFASRMRMSRPIRQLWDVREQFIRHERGWNGAMDDERVSPSGSDDEKTTEPVPRRSPDKRIERRTPGLHLHDGVHRTQGPKSNNVKFIVPRETEDEPVQKRLNRVEAYYVSQDFSTR